MQRRPDGVDYGAPFAEIRQSARAFFAICQVISWPLSAWTRKFGTWGERHASGHMAMGWMAILLFALVAPDGGPGPLLALWAATGVMLLLHRVKGAWLRRRGHWVPSMYTGLSRVPGDEWKAKGVWEPGLAILFGIALCFWSAPVGAWFVAAGVAQGLAVGFARDEERAVVRAARDARFRAQYEMDLLRKELGEE